MNQSRWLGEIRGFLPRPAPRTGDVDVLVLSDDAFLCQARLDGALALSATGGVLAYYRTAWPRRVVLKWDSPPDVAVHELAHAVMDSDWGVISPRWLCEGFAEMIMSVLCRGRLPLRRRRAPEAVTAPPGILYGSEFQRHYDELAEHVTFLAARVGMRSLLRQYSVFQ
jgi:hypothetical protein